jgi:signal transduction histidine kinase
VAVRLSVTTRIALLSIALALASNLAVIVFVWQRTESDAVETVRRDVTEQADTLAAVWREGGAPALAAAIDEAKSSPDPTHLAMVADARGRRIDGDGPLQIDAVALAPTRFRIARIARAEPWSDHDAGYVLRPVGQRWLLVGRSLLVVEQQRHALERALIVAVLVSLALGVAAGVIVSRYVARRLVRIAGVVDAVGAGDLTRRVPLIADGRADAFDRLAGRLNATLDRVERLMGELRVVTDSLAHDLRSPLARLRTRAEQAVELTDPAAREAALAGLLTETDLVMRMLSTVIEISRSETASRDRFTLVDPAALLAEIADLYEPVVEEGGRPFALALDAAPAPMPLHRELLSQALGNLVENSLKHGAGALTLALGENGEGITIEVRDRGPGIAEADRAEALRRFGRLDAARTTPGAGLGMALVDAVARLHGGRFELADHAPGLVARIVLPR